MGWAERGDSSVSSRLSRGSVVSCTQRGSSIRWPGRLSVAMTGQPGHMSFIQESGLGFVSMATCRILRGKGTRVQDLLRPRLRTGTSSFVQRFVGRSHRASPGSRDRYIVFPS